MLSEEFGFRIVDVWEHRCHNTQRIADNGRDIVSLLIPRGSACLLTSKRVKTRCTGQLIGID